MRLELSDNTSLSSLKKAWTAPEKVTSIVVKENYSFNKKYDLLKFKNISFLHFNGINVDHLSLNLNLFKDLKSLKIENIDFNFDSFNLPNSIRIFSIKNVKNIDLSRMFSKPIILDALWIDNVEEKYLLENLDNEIRFLSIRNSNLTELPQWIYSHYELLGIDFSFNKLDYISDEINKLHKLQELWLISNSLNQNTLKLKGNNLISKLFIQKNEFTEIPNWLFEMQQLKELSIGENNINYIPQEISSLKNLSSLNLEGLKLNNISQEIMQLNLLSYVELKDSEIRCKKEVYDFLFNLYGYGAIQYLGLPL